MTELPEHTKTSLQWFDKAEHDLIAARHLLTLENACPYDTVAFHAHQCAEKRLKGYLSACRKQFTKTHDLHMLISLFPDNHFSEIIPEKISLLNRFAIESRYPGDWEPISKEDALEGLSVAEEIYRLTSIKNC